jgi:hypothetical protein
VHSLTTDDVNRSGERCGDGRYEDGEAAVRQYFNDEGRDERLFDLDECRLPHVLAALSGKSSREASKEPVARKSLEECPVHAVSDPAHPRPNTDADQKTDD